MNRNTDEKDRTAELLCEMYRNVKMGCENIVGIMPKVNDRFMISELTQGLEGYSRYAKTLENMMHERGMVPEPPGKIAKIGTKIGIALSTAVDSTPAALARVYINGTKNEIRRLSQVCENMAGSCDAGVVGLCGQIIEKERIDAAKMERFL